MVHRISYSSAERSETPLRKSVACALIFFLLALGIPYQARAGAITKYLFATGGTITTVTQNGIIYKIHTFTTTGTSTFSVTGGSGKVWYLVVAGGGGGGGTNDDGGGGGAGGLLTNGGYTYAVSAGSNYTVTVGAGGTGAGASGHGVIGADSVFDTITATGGGGGGFRSNTNDATGRVGGNGGSGGGGAIDISGGAYSDGGTGTAGQGNNGGGSGGGSAYGSGGGGGAGGAGSTGTTLVGGNGGAGTNSNISGSTVCYAGGGGGGARIDGSYGTATCGGGHGGSSTGTGLPKTASVAGTANTGGGGGGGTAFVNPGMNGGSGVVIIRYAIGGAGIKTAGDPYWNKVVLLAVNDNQANNSTTFTDQSPYNRTITPRLSSKYITANPPPGLTSSLEVQDTTNYGLLVTSDSNLASYASGNFVIDFYVRRTGQGNNVFNFNTDGVGTNVGINVNNASIQVYNIGGVNRVAATTVDLNTWYHVAVVRSGTTFYIFKDGAYVDSWTDTHVPANGTDTMKLGAQWPGLVGAMVGQLAGIRVTKGTDRGWTVNFTRPTLPLPTYQRLAVKQKTNTSQNTSLTNGLVGLWSFDGPDMAGVTAYDRSGGGNNGTLTAGPTRVLGKIGQALNFDGVDDYVTIPTISIPSSITASAWVYSTNFNQAAMIVMKKPVNVEWELFLENGGGVSNGIKWRGNNAAGDEACATTAFPSNNQWHHIVATQSGTTCNIYLDGALVKNATVSAIANGTTSGTNDILISTHNGSAYPFNGRIDDVRLYNRALSPAEVKQLYNQGR